MQSVLKWHAREQLFQTHAHTAENKSFSTVIYSLVIPVGKEIAQRN